MRQPFKYVEQEHWEATKPTEIVLVLQMKRIAWKDG